MKARFETRMENQLNLFSLNSRDFLQDNHANAWIVPRLDCNFYFRRYAVLSTKRVIK
jgi:hypothetical protein